MTTGPRIPPLSPEERSDEVNAMLDAGIAGTDHSLGQLNLFPTLARHPKLFRKWLPFGGYLLGGATLPARDRELLILRTSARCKAAYEWSHHAVIARRVGIDQPTIDRVLEGPDAEGWSAHEATLLRAVDELHDTATLTDDTWAALAREYDQAQLIETTMLVGEYHMVAFTLNATGVELEAGSDPLPDGFLDP
jgi:4-carboxymuconolactone decarboxylase